MTISPVINFNVDLTSSPSSQINNLKCFLQSLKEEFPDVSFATQTVNRSSPATSQIPREHTPGPNEKAYLEFKGITRLKHTNKALSREAQAAHYLIQAGITPPVPLDQCDLPPENTPDSSNDIQEDEEEFDGDPVV